MADKLRAAGALVVRSPQSGQAMDLTVLWPDPDAGKSIKIEVEPRSWLVQCKLGGYMRPADREELIALADRYGCVPVLAGGRNPVKYTDLRTGGSLEISPNGDVRPGSRTPDR